jgi:hypothetical protein
MFPNPPKKAFLSEDPNALTQKLRFTVCIKKGVAGGCVLDFQKGAGATPEDAIASFHRVLALGRESPSNYEIIDTTQKDCEEPQSS